MFDLKLLLFVFLMSQTEMMEHITDLREKRPDMRIPKIESGLRSTMAD